MRRDEATRIARQALTLAGPARTIVWADDDALASVLREQGVDASTRHDHGAALPSADLWIIETIGNSLTDNIGTSFKTIAPALIFTSPPHLVSPSLIARLVELGWGPHPRSFGTPQFTAMLKQADAVVAAERREDLMVYDLLANFVAMGDRVLQIGGTELGRQVLAANSGARGVDLIHPASEIQVAQADLDGAGLLLLFDGRAEAALRWWPKVKPGGRLAMIGGAHTPGAADLIALLGKDAVLERGFVFANDILQECDVEDPPAGLVITLIMRDPLSCAETPYVERAFRVPAEDAFAVADFARDYRYPPIVRSIVTRGTRLSVPDGLAGLIQRLLPAVPPASVDRGALLCTLAYQALELEFEDAVLASLVEHVEAWLRAMPDLTRHGLRWTVSLLAVKARLELHLGRMDDALETCRRCAAQDATPYSPLLAARTLEALFIGATILLGRGDREDAVAMLDQAIPMAHFAVAGDWLNVVGDVAEPLPFGLPELSHVLDAAARCATLRGLIGRFEHHPGFVWERVHVLARQWPAEAAQPGVMLGAAGRGTLAAARRQAAEGYRLALEAELQARRANDHFAARTAQLSSDLQSAVDANAGLERELFALRAELMDTAPQRIAALEREVERLALLERTARKSADAARLDARRAREQLAAAQDRLTSDRRNAAESGHPDEVASTS